MYDRAIRMVAEMVRAVTDNQDCVLQITVTEDHVTACLLPLGQYEEFDEEEEE